jgi:phosphatidylglycerophosphate synthase
MSGESATTGSWSWWRLFPFSRHLAKPLLAVLMRLPVTPNQVTAASLACGLGAGACFAFPGHEGAGAALLIACYLLDNCDGDIARAKGLSSRFGHYFDSVNDWLVDSAFFAGLGVGTATTTGDRLWLWLGLAAAAGATISYFLELAHDLRQARAAGDSPEAPALNEDLPVGWKEATVYAFRELTRADFCFIVLALVLSDMLWVLLPLGAIGAQIYWATSLMVGWRRFHV